LLIARLSSCKSCEQERLGRLGRPRGSRQTPWQRQRRSVRRHLETVEALNPRDDVVLQVQDLETRAALRDEVDALDRLPLQRQLAQAR
jgi:hypothetical protein